MKKATNILFIQLVLFSVTIAQDDCNGSLTNLNTVGSETSNEGAGCYGLLDGVGSGVAGAAWCPSTIDVNK